MVLVPVISHNPNHHMEELQRLKKDKSTTVTNSGVKRRSRNGLFGSFRMREERVFLPTASHQEAIFTV